MLKTGEYARDAGSAWIRKTKQGLLLLGKQYSKVPEAEFIELVNKSKAPIPYEETLREDYEIGIVKTDRDTKPQFYVYYSARCTTCKFAFKYRHEENV